MGQSETGAFRVPARCPWERRQPRKLRRTRCIPARDWGRHFRETSRLERVSALGSLADISTAMELVCFAPIADIQKRRASTI